jgi:hypothetical protein
MRKFCWEGLLPTFALLVAEKRPVTLDDHISEPGLSGEMSPATQRPVSAPFTGDAEMTAQVRPSYT